MWEIGENLDEVGGKIIKIYILEDHVIHVTLYIDPELRFQSLLYGSLGCCSNVLRPKDMVL